MVRFIHVFALAAVQLLGCAVALPADNAQHVLLDPQGHSAKDVHAVQDELKKAEIIPTVIDDFLPSLLVGVEWPSSKSADLGNTIKPKKLQEEPSITLTRPKSTEGACGSVANVTYTVTLTDPDAPSRDDPKWSEMCHWIATGLATSDGADLSCSSSLTLSLTDLDDLMPYKPPGPPEKTGKHRYVLFVFAPANGTTDPLDLKKPEDRQHWGYEYEGESVGVRRWSLENGLVPVAAYRPDTKNAYRSLPKSPESTAEALQRLENDRAKTNKNFENWNKALEVFALGWRPPKVYYPIVISSNSPVSMPQKLQDMAGMTATPRVFNTTYTTMHGGIDAAHQTDGKAEEVQVGEVGWDELVKVTEEAEFDDWLFVFAHGKVRTATMIKSFKKGDKHEGEQDVVGQI